MPVIDAPTPKPSRRARPVVALALIALLVLVAASGCASLVAPEELAAFDSQHETISRWARNPIVCAPTAIGNSAGAVAGFPLAVLALGPAVLAEHLLGDEGLAFRIYGSAYWAPVLAGGAVTGSLFLPLADLIDEHPCDLGVSTVGAHDEPTGL
jgi:hypothetical protein